MDTIETINLSTASDTPFWDNPFDCSCDMGQQFINFWTSAGQCCDNLRLTIWYSFNIVFLLMVIFAMIKICRENKKRRKDAVDFTERVQKEAGKHYSEGSSASSVAEPLFRDD